MLLLLGDSSADSLLFSARKTPEKKLTRSPARTVVGSWLESSVVLCDKLKATEWHFSPRLFVLAERLQLSGIPETKGDKNGKTARVGVDSTVDLLHQVNKTAVVDRIFISTKSPHSETVKSGQESEGIAPECDTNVRRFLLSSISRTHYRPGVELLQFGNWGERDVAEFLQPHHHWLPSCCQLPNLSVEKRFEPLSACQPPLRLFTQFLFP